MPRPNRDRVTVTAYISRDARDQLDQLATRFNAPDARYQVTRSDLIRLAVTDYLNLSSSGARAVTPTP